jgi:hypothetical protein
MIESYQNIYNQPKFFVMVSQIKLGRYTDGSNFLANLNSQTNAKRQRFFDMVRSVVKPNEPR